ncbi:MAG: metallophosphoesterase [Planctomycetes bacterium]|nr:metallophosphoesterase [Planctomycetota bacterium]
MTSDTASPESIVRLAHFSDIHLTARPLGWRLGDLFTKRTTGWLNHRLGRGQRFRDADRIVQVMMQVIRERGFDRVIFSGDATTLGFTAEIDAAAGKLDLSLPGLAVPGNHDYYTRSAVRAGDFERNFAPWQTGERIGTEIYPFAQRVGHCWLIGVNSARSNFLLWDARGGVGHLQANRLQELLNRLPPGPRILVTHYPLYLADGLPESHWRRLRDWKSIRHIAAECGIALWLHGHRHVGYVLPSSPERPFPSICAGSATQTNRWAWNEYEIRGKHLLLRRRVWDPSVNGFVEEQSAEIDLSPHT